MGCNSQRLTGNTLIIRKKQNTPGMEQVFYNKIEIWPGFLTALKQMGTKYVVMID